MSGNTPDQTVATSQSSPSLSRIGLNVHKAGMEGLDQKKINQIILEASKGSKYYLNEVRKEQEVLKRVDHMLATVKQLTAAQRASALKTIDKQVEVMEESRNLSKIIVHVDMDAFYASVEMRDNPGLNDRPMAVGSHSMLSTSNYAARRFGVRAAMPGFIAKKLCPELVIVPPNFDKYQKVSEEVKTILSQYDPTFCPVGLDESYLDITDYVKRKVKENTIKIESIEEDHNLSGSPHCSHSSTSSLLMFPLGNHITPELPRSYWVHAEQVVEEVRAQICMTTGLTASAGIAPNKILAKIASDKNKPNGQFLVEPTREGILRFLHHLPIRKICGIGQVTEKMLNALDITLCHHLYDKRDTLQLIFSKCSFQFFLATSLGIGSVEVSRWSERKSMSIERSFSEISDPTKHMAKCQELCKLLAHDMEREEIQGRTVTIKLKTIGFEVKSRGTTVSKPISKYQEVYQVSCELLKQEIKASSPFPLRLRLMGIRISNLQISGCRSLKSYLKPAPSIDQDASSCSNFSEETDFITYSHTFESDRELAPELIASSTCGHGSPAATNTCPLCGSQISTDNDILNKHVDECLNKSAVIKAVKESQQLPIRSARQFQGKLSKRQQPNRKNNGTKKKKHS